MNPIVYHLASGESFISGTVLLLLAVRLSYATTTGLRRAGQLLSLVGLTLVALSTAAIPFWLNGIGLVAIAIFLGLGGKKPKVAQPAQESPEPVAHNPIAATSRRKPGRVDAAVVSRFAVVAIVLLALVFELPYHVEPTIEPVKGRTLTVIGDSITAGMGSGDETLRWPQRLAANHSLQVQDLARPGETLESAWSRNQAIPIEGNLVILEIGGNDLLGSTTEQEFQSSLRKLLTLVADGQRQVIMFELPLLPLQHRFGRAQRILAHEFDVKLLPKRLLLEAISGKQSTVDSIHLTEQGHEKMASIVWRVISPAFR